MSAEKQTLAVEIKNHIATITLNRPESRNALNSAMCDEWIKITEALSADEQVRVVVIRGAGAVFCAGADLKERQQMSTAEISARRIKGFMAYAAIERLPQAVIAMVQGPAVGSGCEIAGASDFILASSTASFRYPEVGWGTVGATQRLPRIVGVRMAKELLFTGRAVSAEEGMRLGLVNQVYAPDQLESEVYSMAERIAQANPLTLRLTKRSLDQGVETTREGAMAVEILAIEENLRGTDWKKAIAGFGTGDKA